MPKYYTGIGSRKTPQDILDYMMYLGETLAPHYTLRSGKAQGADEAFQLGVEKKRKQKGFNYVCAQIFIPWKDFKNPKLSNEWDFNLSSIEFYAGRKALEHQEYLLENLHPHFNSLSSSAKKLHMRNINQVIGLNVISPDPSEFVVFYANEEKGKISGGTATAVNLARKLDIPTFNLKNKEDKIKLIQFLKGKNIDVME